MANVKISQLPAVSSLSNTDVLPAVATSTTSKITLGNLANSITGVTSSISASLAQTASFVKNAQTASYVLNAVTASFVTLAQTASFVTTAQTASYVDGNSFTTDNKALSASNAITASYVDGASFISANPALSASYALTASYALNGGAGDAFPYTGSAQITGSLGVTGSISTTDNLRLGGSILMKNSGGSYDNYIFLNPNDSLTLTAYGNGVRIIGGGGTLIATISSGTNNFVLSGSAIISESLTVYGELNATSSQALTASYVDGNSFTVDNPALSASYALTASYALNGGGGAAFPFTGDAHIYGKLVVTGSLINGAVGNVASGLNSHAEGDSTTATANAAHAEGINSTAIGVGSHAEGDDTDAIGNYSHAEGRLTKAVGYWSHAEGSSTYASGAYSHAEGRNTLASASYSHAEGHFTTASALYSHTEGYYTIAQGWYQHVQGTYNVTSTNQYAFIIGNGIDDSNRSNLVYASGSNFEVSGSLIVTGSLNVANGFAVLTQVSESLNFADDTAAAAGGVPLGGIYRSGNFIAIRLV